MLYWFWGPHSSNCEEFCCVTYNFIYSNESPSKFLGNISQRCVCHLLHTGVLLDLFFGPEDGDDNFHQNLSSVPTDITASYPRRDQPSEGLFMKKCQILLTTVGASAGFRTAASRVKIRNTTAWKIFKQKKLRDFSSASELYRPSDSRLSRTLVPIFVGRGYVVSAIDPHGR